MHPDRGSKKTGQGAYLLSKTSQKELKPLKKGHKYLNQKGGKWYIYV
jgi:hypothetical protein